MRIVEILLPHGTSDRSLSPQATRKIDVLQKRMDGYVDKILDPNTSQAGREFLKSKLRDDYYELRNAMPRIHAVAEAITKLPVSHDDFELVKKVMEKPIPAAVAPIYIHQIIEDDELNDQLFSLEESEPNRDIRPLIAEWFRRVMPDQMFRFIGGEPDMAQKNGVLSPIHGYDSRNYKGTNDPITGNAFGMYESIDEMTMRAGSYKFDSFFPDYTKDDMVHTGDVDGYSVYKSEYDTEHEFYYLFKDDICCLQSLIRDVRFNNIDMKELSVIQAKQSGGNLTSVLLWFIKDQEKYPIVFGNRLSTAMIENIKKIYSTGRFKMKWMDDSGQVTDFTPETMGDFTSLTGPTKWHLIAESGNSGLPKFFDRNNFLSGFTLF